jgi:hypothetical protein
MKLSAGNLSSRMTTADVAVLQSELVQLGYSIPATETGTQLIFGTGTQQAVQDFQRKRGLPVTGVVDQVTAKRINAAVDAIVPARFVVNGQVRHQDGSPLGGLRVTAFDKDLRNAEPLGEATTGGTPSAPGHYEIAFTPDKFRKAEKRTADVFVRVFSPEGIQIAESPVHFNVPATLTLDLIASPLPVVTLSEYEELVADLTPVLDEVGFAKLTADDVTFLTAETGEPAARIQMLQQAAQLAPQADIVAEAPYGWLSQKTLPPSPTLGQLLDVPTDQLSASLTRAIAANTIPARVKDSLDAIVARITRLQRQRAAKADAKLVRRQFVGKLLDQQSGTPLARFRVQGFDLDAGSIPTDLGVDITNGSGLFGLTYKTPPVPARIPPLPNGPPRASDPTMPPISLSEPAPRKLSLHVSNPDGAEFQTVNVQAASDDSQAVEVRVTVPPAVVPPSPTFTELGTTLSLNLPKPLLDFLAGKNIHSLADIQKAGGIGHLDGLPLAPDDPSVRTLEAHASLLRLSSDVKFNDALITKNYTSPAAIANAPRSNFVNAAQGQLGDFKAAEMHVKARAQTGLLDNFTAGFLADKANGFVANLPGPIAALGTQFPDKCGCEDCQAAVSPGAYLADLLDYAVRHITNQGSPIFPQFLQDTFHQPLHDLPSDCEAMDRKVRQVRICIEVLRSYLGGQSLSPAAERDYLVETYITLLKLVGTSYEEIRLARTDTSENRQALADRLGIDLDMVESLKSITLDALLLDASADPAVILEADIERLFGLVDTTRDPLSDGVKFGDSTPAQITSWRLTGVEWGRNTDQDGNIYVRLDRPSTTVIVQIYRDAQRTKLVAEGSLSTAQGTVLLGTRNRSGLSGTFEVAYSSGGNAISISALSNLLSWRLKHLRTIWHAQDWPIDAYSVTPPTDLQLLAQPPIIDPDLIGPDDFRNPFPKAKAIDPDAPFDLWLRRRQWIDARLAAFAAMTKTVNGQQVPDLSAMLAAMHQPVSYPPVSVVPWGLTAQPERFDTLMDQLSQGQDKDVEAAKNMIRTDLHLSPESFTRLVAMRTKDQLAADPKNPRLDDDEGREVASILIQAQKVIFFPTWRTEEHPAQGPHMLLGPQDFWFSLREPAEGDWPPAPPLSTPLIDPELLKLSDLPEPTAGKNAIDLWTKRRDQLVTDRQDLKARYKATILNKEDPLQALLLKTLGDPDPANPNKIALPLPQGTDLGTLFTAMNDPDPAKAKPAVDTIGKTLHMSTDDFTTVMALRAKLLDPKAEPSDSEWAQVFGILASAQKLKRSYPDWITEEKTQQPVPLTPAQYWLVRKASLPLWRASAEDRALWRQALRLRSQPPIIEPDLIGPGDLRDPVLNDPDDPAFDLWNARHELVLHQIASFHQAPKTVAGIETIMQGTIGIPTADLIALNQGAQAGDSIDQRLAQLTLPADAFSHLMQIRTLLEKQAALLGSEWDDVASILTQVWKQRMSAHWRDEEQKATGLFFGPECFLIPEPPPITYPPKIPPPLPPWRASSSDRQDWQDALQARIDEVQTVTDALTSAVDATEEATLPKLRDALVWLAQGLHQKQAEFVDLDARAKWVGDTLLIDAKTGGCQQTTRVAQAIETIQTLLYSLRTDLLEDKSLSLDDDQFDEEWQWIGSYATWRAAIFVFLYPENILIPSLRHWQTPAFRQLVSNLRSASRLTPDMARQAAEAYDDYFRDVGQLTLGASCQTRTRVRDGDQKTDFSYLFHMFAQAADAPGLVYWSACDPADNSGYAQSFWEAVPGLTNVVEIVGAASFKTITQQRFIFLFVVTHEKGASKLSYTRYDLDGLSWDGDEQDLDLPDDAKEFVAVLKQRRRENAPPQLALQLRSLTNKARSQQLCYIIYSRSLNDDCSDWEDDDWFPIATPSKGAELGQPVAWVEVETEPDLSCILTLSQWGDLSYRLLGKPADAKATDDAHWQSLGTQLSGPAQLLGAFGWPGTSDVYVFWANAGVVIKTASRLVGAYNFSTLDDIETWLNDVAGLSLTDYSYSFSDGAVSLYRCFQDFLFINSQESMLGAHAKNDLMTDALDVSTLIYASITNPNFVKLLYKLRLTLVIDDLSDKVGSATDFRDADVGSWWVVDKIASDLSRLSIGDMLKGFAGLVQHDVAYLDHPASVHTEFAQVNSPISRPARIVPCGGEAPAEVRLFACQTLDGMEIQRFQLKQSGVELSHFRSTRVAPLAGVPSATSERLTETKLQLRRVLIEGAFLVNQDGPPTNMTYLQEAYYFVPVHLALQLQAVGEYTAALDWYRIVYDYGVPMKQRKIYYGLAVEENEPDVYQRGPNWLLDPLNPHQIAETRKNTYTRFTLMSIIGCHLDAGDADFTLDTPESVPRARLHYLRALDLLDTAELQQKPSQCDDVIGELDIDVKDTAWAPVSNALARELRGIGDLATLRTTAASVTKALTGPDPLSSRFAKARDLIAEAKATLPPRPSLSELVESKASLQARAHTALLTVPEISTATEAAAMLASSKLQRSVSLITGVEVSSLEQDKVAMPWLRQPRGNGAVTPVGSPPGSTPLRSDFRELTRENPLAPSATAGLAKAAAADPISAMVLTGGLPFPFTFPTVFRFCIPPNPILRALRLHAELNLYKIRTCRNIAGIKRELDPYAAPTDTFSGLPVIGAGGQLVLPGLATLQPTPYRYSVLIERAKQMVGLAQQLEASMLSAIEKGDAERYGLLKARQDVELTQAGVRLQTLRVKVAQDGVKLAELQQNRAQIQMVQYAQWIAQGISGIEQTALDMVRAQVAVEGAYALGNLIFGDTSAGVSALVASYSGAVSIATTLASYERRRMEWQFQENLSQQDFEIAGQQVTTANDNVRVADQEQVIAGIQSDHAKAVVDFLSNKFTNVDLYDWMGNVLGGVYSFFLQQATSLAQLAASQLAFERQEVPPPYIQADYWQPPADGFGSADGKGPDRRGLTGSARLLQDISQLDEYAFDTNKRKLQLSKTISLAQTDPFTFQRFRESGVLPFDTPMELFDRDFPGHYLRLVRRVRASVIALIPPSLGIRATLTTTGTSRVVIGGDIFQTVRIHRDPDQVALSSPSNATGLFELDTQPEMLLPFEGVGVDTHWEFRMPRAANPFDYSTIADVLVTLDYTALNSFDYYQQVIQSLRPTLSADRPYSFRQLFADQWYDLNNPDRSATPMTVGFSTVRDDFPPNLDNLKIAQVVLYFARADGKTFEVPVTSLTFTELGGAGPVGGGASSVDGVISTRTGNAGGWMAMLGLSPFGDWKLALPNTEVMRNRFTNAEIEEILLVITFSGRTPAWPV